MINEILKNIDILQFQKDLLDWYDKNKRDLPWRRSKDPYKIWVSEIMLQQTKVDTVIPYFERFVEKYPTVEDLAHAEEAEVLKMWEGLGYYSRAKNLHSAVKEVASEYGGKVPENPEQLGALKGVGPYTKGAILSIAFDQAEPAVDGNVLRVFSRILEIDDDISKQSTKKAMEEYVRAIISKEDPSSFNQAIMDLGATICTPTSPACLLCPVQEHCKAFANGVQEYLPIKKKAKKQKTIHYVALVIQDEDERYVIEKRPSKGLLADLWQFPMVPIDEVKKSQMKDWLLEEYGITITQLEKREKIKHVFSHLIWELEVFTARLNGKERLASRLLLVNKEEIKDYTFPVSHQKMMKYL